MIKHNRNRLQSCFSLITVIAPMIFGGHLEAADDAKPPAEKKEEDALREQQLKNMRRSATQYKISLADDSKRQLKFHENAAMRFSNPVTRAKDGAIYVWTEHGRPQAIFKLYTYDNEIFHHEWQSLSESALVAERDGKIVWSPTEPGIDYRELPDAPKPAETAAERLRQMKSLAGKFSSTYTDIPRDAKPVELRLLIQPLFRFEVDNESKFLDGAIFGFAQGTAPPAILLIEARRAGESHRWYYAFAKMASGSVNARLGEKEIFSVEKYDFSRDPKKTFFWLPRQPVPKE